MPRYAQPGPGMRIKPFQRMACNRQKRNAVNIILAMGSRLSPREVTWYTAPGYSMRKGRTMAED
jgi:hypothetical protein